MTFCETHILFVIVTMAHFPIVQYLKEREDNHARDWTKWLELMVSVEECSVHNRSLWMTRENVATAVLCGAMQCTLNTVAQCELSVLNVSDQPRGKSGHDPSRLLSTSVPEALACRYAEIGREMGRQVG